MRLCDLPNGHASVTENTHAHKNCKKKNMYYLFAFLGNLEEEKRRKTISASENEVSASLESQGSCPYKDTTRGKAETHIAVNMIILIKRQRSSALRLKLFPGHMLRSDLIRSSVRVKRCDLVLSMQLDRSKTASFHVPLVTYSQLLRVLSLIRIENRLYTDRIGYNGSPDIWNFLELFEIGHQVINHQSDI